LRDCALYLTENKTNYFETWGKTGGAPVHRRRRRLAAGGRCRRRRRCIGDRGAPVLRCPPWLRCLGDLCSALHRTTLHCTALHCTALQCNTLHCTALHCTALHAVQCSAVQDLLDLLCEEFGFILSPIIDLCKLDQMYLLDLID
jgi:hypothetical protein